MAVKDKNTSRFLVIVFIIGVALIILGLVLAVNYSKFYHNSDQVRAEITKIIERPSGDDDTDYDVYVTYEYKGVTYTNIKINSYSSTMREGKKITILVDRNNPKHIKTKSSVRVAWIIPLVIGGVCCGVSGVVVYRQTINFFKKKKYVKHGRLVVATISEIKESGNLKVNNRKSNTVTLIGDIDGLNLLFEVKGVYDTNGLIVGNSVNVYVDEYDYEKYYVDLFGKKE